MLCKGGPRANQCAPPAAKDIVSVYRADARASEDQDSALVGTALGTFLPSERPSGEEKPVRPKLNYLGGEIQWECPFDFKELHPYSIDSGALGFNPSAVSRLVAKDSDDRDIAMSDMSSVDYWFHERFFDRSKYEEKIGKARLEELLEDSVAWFAHTIKLVLANPPVQWSTYARRSYSDEWQYVVTADGTKLVADEEEDDIVEIWSATGSICANTRRKSFLLPLRWPRKISPRCGFVFLVLSSMEVLAGCSADCFPRKRGTNMLHHMADMDDKAASSILTWSN